MITPLSEPVSLILREFLLSVTKYVTHHENTACASISDSSALAGQKETQKLQVDVGLRSSRNLFGSADQVFVSLDPDRPFPMHKVR
jgi:hypothetical protein